MSWHYLRARVVESWPDPSLDGAPDALLKLIPFAERSFSEDKRMDSLNPSPSGMTSEPLTDFLGVDALTSSPGDSPARILALPVQGPGSTGNGLDFGENLLGSFAKWNQDMSSWRTLQPCLFEEWGEFSETWPKWGMMRNGACWALSIPVLPTSENESGSWPTPTASMMTMGDLEQARFEGTDPRRPKYPKAFPTPAARDYRHPNKKPYAERGGTSKGEQLPNAIGGPLNPVWVEWLMGWPLGWSGLGQVNLETFHAWRQTCQNVLADYEQLGMGRFL